MKRIILSFLSLLLTVSTVCYAQKKVSYTYPNGNKKQEGTLIDGNKDGTWTTWNENGDIEEEIVYENGVVKVEKNYNGGCLWKETYYNLHPKFVFERKYSSCNWWLEHFLTRAKKEIAYENSCLYEHLSRISYSYNDDNLLLKNWLPNISFYDDGSIARVRCGTNVVAWHENGILREVDGYFHEGKKRYWYRWNEAGQRVDNMLKVIENDTVTFNTTGVTNKLQYSLKDNRPQGVWKDYYTNNKLWFKIEYKNGVPVGDYESYYFNGNPQIRAHFTDGFIDGKYTEWHENGNKRAEGRMNLCMKDSTWRFWSENGTLIKQASYKNDVLDGEYFEYFSDGSLKEKKMYKNGKLEGWEYVYYAKDTLKSVKYYYNGYWNYGERKEYYRKGTLEYVSYENVKLTAKYADNGVCTELRSDVFSINWRKDGTLFNICYGDNDTSAYIYFENGEIKRNEYRVNKKPVVEVPYTWMYPKNGKIEIRQVGDSINGKREGKWTLYYPSGDVWIEMNFRNDLLDGDYIVRSIDGIIVKKVQLKNGLVNGTYEEWSTSGKKLIEQHCIEGKKDGVMKEWKELDGTYYLAKVSNYTNNEYNGDLYQFSVNGDTLYHTHYNNGIVEGLIKGYDKTEHYHSSTCTYRAGKKHGEAIIYAKDGSILWKGNYYNDKRHGVWIQYNKAGQEVERVQYEHGDEILAPIELECQCTTNYKSKSGSHYFPAIKNLADYKTFSKATSKYIHFEEDIYNKLRYNKFSTDGGMGSRWVAMDVVAFDTLWFETPATHGLRFVVNPCLNRNQYSSTAISLMVMGNKMSYYYEFDEDSFDYQATSFFTAAISMFKTFEPLEFVMLFSRFISKIQGISAENGYNHLKKLLQSNGITVLPEYIHQLDSLSEEQYDAFEKNKDKMVSIMAKKYFNYGKIKLESVNKDFERRFNIFFLYNFAFEEFVSYMFMSYDASIDISQIAIDFPKDILAQWDSKNKKLATYNGTSLGARLLLSVNPISISSDEGFYLENQRDFCFTTAAIGGKQCILKAEKAEVYHRTQLYEAFEIHPDFLADFILKNGYTTFAGVHIPNGHGTIMIDEKECDITYTDVFVTGTYILGQITIQDENIVTKKLSKQLKKYFTKYSIETLHGKTTVFFLYKKS